MKGIARCVVAAPAPDARLTAQKALLALLMSLDAWAGPLKVHRLSSFLCVGQACECAQTSAAGIVAGSN